VTAADPTGDGLAAALIQISAHAERISAVDAREAAHYEDLAARLRDLADQSASLTTRADEISATLARQQAILTSLDGLDAQVASLAAHLTSLADDQDDAGHYQPVPAPRWWKLTGDERDTALDRLRAWVEQIYRPNYGQLAAALPPCWEHHPACLYTLDWLSELWSLLYLAPQRDRRTLAAQAEWHTRLLPAAADHMATEATGCPHSATSAHHLAVALSTEPANRVHPRPRSSR
jgi:hypothetical protein